MATRRLKGGSPSPSRSPSPPRLSKPPAPSKAKSPQRASPSRIATKSKYVYILRRVEEGDGQNTHTFSVRTAVYSTMQKVVKEYIAFMVREYQDLVDEDTYEKHLKRELGLTLREAKASLLEQLKTGNAELSHGLDYTEFTIRRVKLDAPMSNEGRWDDDVIQ